MKLIIEDILYQELAEERINLILNGLKKAVLSGKDPSYTVPFKLTLIEKTLFENAGYLVSYHHTSDVIGLPDSKTCWHKEPFTSGGFW